MQNYDYIHQLKHHIASTEGDLSEETFQNIISAIENNIQPPPLNNGVIDWILFKMAMKLWIKLVIYFNI